MEGTPIRRRWPNRQNNTDGIVTTTVACPIITGAGPVRGGSDAAGERLEESFPRWQEREYSDGIQTPRRISSDVR
jgi:hypothetical protein